MSWDKETFRNRREAGQLLAGILKTYRGRQDVVVLALPRGGVPVAYEVAKALKAPLDILVVRKLGFPGQEELAMGAVASGGVKVLNPGVIRGVPEPIIEEVARREAQEVARREQEYRRGGSGQEVAGKMVILIDDGLATGASMRAAVRSLRARGPAKVVVAVPVGAKSTCREMRSVADEVICLREVEPLQAVGLWYEDFDQTSDKEVAQLLAAFPGK